MKKNPVLAALLNFALFGGGTLYVGKRPGVAIALIVGGTAAQVGPPRGARGAHRAPVAGEAFGAAPRRTGCTAP